MKSIVRHKKLLILFRSPVCFIVFYTACKTIHKIMQLPRTRVMSCLYSLVSKFNRQKCHLYHKKTFTHYREINWFLPFGIFITRSPLPIACVIVVVTFNLFFVSNNCAWWLYYRTSNNSYPFVFIFFTVAVHEVRYVPCGNFYGVFLACRERVFMWERRFSDGDLCSMINKYFYRLTMNHRQRMVFVAERSLPALNSADFTVWQCERSIIPWGAECCDFAKKSLSPTEIE